MKRFFVCFAFFMISLFFIGCGEKNETTMGLQWSKLSQNSMVWAQALMYCKTLDENGHNDWRLPNIDDLRTLIQNHSGTQTGGTCPISEKAGNLYWGESPDDCRGQDGNNFSKLNDNDWFWSSSVLAEDSKHAWGVNFDNGALCQSGMNIGNAVRCVRNTE